MRAELQAVKFAPVPEQSIQREAHKYHYTILLHPDEEQGGYWVTVPALPGCYSQGDTLEDAIAKVRDAIHLYISTLISEGEPIPEEDAAAQAVTIDVDAPAASGHRSVSRARGRPAKATCSTESQRFCWPKAPSTGLWSCCNVFFQKLRDDGLVGFRSELDVAMTKAAKVVE